MESFSILFIQQIGRMSSLEDADAMEALSFLRKGLVCSIVACLYSHPIFASIAGAHLLLHGVREEVLSNLQAQRIQKWNKLTVKSKEALAICPSCSTFRPIWIRRLMNDCCIRYWYIHQDAILHLRRQRGFSCLWFCHKSMALKQITNFKQRLHRTVDKKETIEMC